MVNLRAAARAVLLGLAVSVALAACRSLPGPVETTPDGLVRVPSRKAAGVYRAPGAPFIQYKKFIVEPLTVEFGENWYKNFKDVVSEKEIRRMRDEAAQIFREEFTEVLIGEAGYQLAEEPGEDVLLLAPALTELVMPGAETESGDVRMLVRKPTMTLTGELRDSRSGKLVGRVIYIAPGDPHGSQMYVASRTSNAHELRLVFTQWIRIFREALDVAKTERPREE